MAYSNGKIKIPQVTGNIVITVTTAQKQAPPLRNLADPSSEEWKSGYRINSSAQILSMGNSQVTNLIPVAVGDIIRVKNAGQLATYIAATFADASATQGTKMDYTKSYDSTTGVATYNVTGAAHGYARFSFLTADVVGTVDDIIITRNQEIPAN